MELNIKKKKIKPLIKTIARVLICRATEIVKLKYISNGCVTAKAYDILGNKVATLVDGCSEAGSYEVEFEALVFHQEFIFTNCRQGHSIR